MPARTGIIRSAVTASAPTPATSPLTDPLEGGPSRRARVAR